ncbi:zinc/iron-chelating domain-containing protein [Pseudoalteromonas sp. A25]|uniref:YkgJ family cysteine cluster protein n=1 Tax=Pseudoalteromonas sp. A25 TaxID=116092 RepID=UPI001260B967|nr:YkgJ family cysteine cluster protein [Pseudoalteromonas sp. A25]BBN81588.1 zinc/iron-chelating domain-containing protein [Pseudoalteromonas sp. A25]
MECRLHCGACCIAPSISSSFPNHPEGKPAGERCKNLTDDNLCKLFGKPERPKVCHDFKATPWVCGNNSSEAITILNELETLTG